MSTVETLYRFEQEQGYCVVSFLPVMNDAQLAAIDSIGGDVLGRLDPIKSPALVVDLSNLAYIGSAMVALIVKIWKAVKARNGRMVVQTDNDMVLEVLRIAGLQQIWTIVATRDEALQSLGIAPRRVTATPTSDSVPAGADRPGALWAVVLGLLALIGAAGALALYFYQASLLQRTVIEDRQALLLAAVCGAAGLILGTVAAVRGGGGQRVVGGVVVAGCLAAVIVAALRLAEAGVPAAQPAAGREVRSAARPLC